MGPGEAMCERVWRRHGSEGGGAIVVAGENENSALEGTGWASGEVWGGWRRERTHDSAPRLITSVCVISGRPANIRAVALIYIPYRVGNMAAQLMNSTVSGGGGGVWGGWEMSLSHTETTPSQTQWLCLANKIYRGCCAVSPCLTPRLNVSSHNNEGLGRVEWGGMF